MSTARLEVSDLTVELGGQRVLHQISFELHAGERFVLAGPSGSGKSTLLRAIAGLCPIQSGEIWLDGRPIHDLPAGQRQIGMLFQQAALLPHLNVLDNLCMGLRARGVRKAAAQERAKAIAQRLEISEHLYKKPKALSGGEQQRVALGRAMLRDGGLILLDEPMSALDAPLRARLRGELMKLHQDSDISFLHVTHDQQEALAMADRLAVMNEGRLLQIDSPQSLYQKPKHQFVAGFIGHPSMNFLRLNYEDGQYYWQGQPLCPAEQSAKKAILGIRPEALQLSEPGQPRSFAVHYQSHEHYGDKLCVYATTGEEQICVSLPPNTALPEGEFHIRWHESDHCLFDAQTGLAL